VEEHYSGRIVAQECLYDSSIAEKRVQKGWGIEPVRRYGALTIGGLKI